MSNSRGVPSQRFALAAGDTERLISSHIGLVATARG